MDQFTRSFQKIIPSLRESTMEIIEQYPIHGTLFLVPAKEREIEVFLHRTKRENAPVVFEFHGGGFVLGDAKK
ncbi:MAG: hypothetical protein PWP24_1154, partial [Clostridiales bacterium]|nr:hypothetical protein [Clostridiales bacterium]